MIHGRVACDQSASEHSGDAVETQQRPDLLHGPTAEPALGAGANILDTSGGGLHPPTCAVKAVRHVHKSEIQLRLLRSLQIRQRCEYASSTRSRGRGK